MEGCVNGFRLVGDHDHNADVGLQMVQQHACSHMLLTRLATPQPAASWAQAFAKGQALPSPALESDQMQHEPQMLVMCAWEIC